MKLNDLGRGLVWLSIVAVAVWLSLNVRGLGHHILETCACPADLELDYAMGVFWWGIFAVGIFALGGKDRWMLFGAWVGKFFVVLVAMLIYEYNYGLDAYTYFNVKLSGEHWLYPGVDFREDMVPTFRPVYMTGTGQRVEEDAPGAAGAIGSENTLRLALLVASVTGPFYHAMKVAFAFLGLWGAWWFYRAVVVGLGRPFPPAFYLLAFFPSIIFWASILGKDPVQFLFLGLYAYGGAVWLVQGRLSGAWYIGVGLLGSFLLRPWIAVMAGGALFLATLLGRSRGWQVALMLVIALPVLFIGGQYVVAQFSSGSITLEFFESIPQGYAAEGVSGVKLEDLATGGSLVNALPLAMFSGLFRPLPFDITNPFTALAAAENTVILLIAVVAIFRFEASYLRDPLVLWPIFYCLMWTGLHGFIVMVNFGSGVRYKLQIWPFLLMAVLLIVHREGRALLASRVPGPERPCEISGPH